MTDTPISTTTETPTRTPTRTGDASAVAPPVVWRHGLAAGCVAAGVVVPVLARRLAR